MLFFFIHIGSKMQVFIVEGKSDTNRLNRYSKSIVTIETSGLGLNNKILTEIENAQNFGHELIVFTDPDSAGESIRRKLNERFSNLKNIYLTNFQQSKIEKKLIGIEHATDEEIKNALSFNLEESSSEMYDLNFLYEYKVVGDKKLRLKICEHFGLAYGNNQKLLKQLNMYKIEKDDLQSLLTEV